MRQAGSGIGRMDQLFPLVIIFSLSYLLGSIPFGLVLTRLAGLGDVRKIGSGNIGATNVLRTGSKKLAAATLFLDGFKGFVAVVLAAMLMPRLLSTPQGGSILLSGVPWLQAAPWLAALGAVIGHVYPVWIGFNGGKGVATYIGVLLAAYWPAALLFAVVWLVMALVFRISSLAALVAITVVALLFAARPQPTVLMSVLLMSGLIIYKHKANIQRLLKGEEPRIGAKA